MGTLSTWEMCKRANFLSVRQRLLLMYFEISLSYIPLAQKLRCEIESGFGKGRKIKSVNQDNEAGTCELGC